MHELFVNMMMVKMNASIFHMKGSVGSRNHHNTPFDIKPKPRFLSKIVACKIYHDRYWDNNINHLQFNQFHLTKTKKTRAKVKKFLLNQSKSKKKFHTSIKMKTTLAFSAVSSLLFATTIKDVKGHGYMLEPMARNYVANPTNNKCTWGREAGVPPCYTDSQSVNKNNGGVCGYDQNDNPAGEMDLWLDSTGVPMKWKSQEIYNAGDTITINTVFTAHHYGHITVSGCPKGRESTQACFDAFPLEFVKDKLYGMPKDPNNTDRGMVHGLDMRLSMKFKLPKDLA